MKDWRAFRMTVVVLLLVIIALLYLIYQKDVVYLNDNKTTEVKVQKI
jgi:nitric oxide reductase large subunit